MDEMMAKQMQSGGQGSASPQGMQQMPPQQDMMAAQADLQQLLQGGPMLRGEMNPQMMGMQQMGQMPMAPMMGQVPAMDNGEIVDRIEQEITEFLSAYPDIDAEEISDAVWEIMKNEGLSLLEAYIKAENTDLKDQILAEKQKQENAQRSAGSRSSSGNDSMQSEFDRWWDED